MKEHHEREAARMRCENLEERRLAVYADITHRLSTGQITDETATRLRKEFWDAATADDMKARKKNHFAYGLDSGLDRL